MLSTVSEASSEKDETIIFSDDAKKILLPKKVKQELTSQDKGEEEVFKWEPASQTIPETLRFTSALSSKSIQFSNSGNVYDYNNL